ncbi:MAG: Arc family DNA-binding protein [Chloroflexi bacterium]|nr:Arc family DNA-binding protein [Chloroflexota bacterium]
MPNVLVRNVPDSVLEALRLRARQHRRSLQQELLAILEREACVPDRRTALQTARAIQEELKRTGRMFSDSALLLSEDRDR